MRIRINDDYNELKMMSIDEVSSYLSPEKPLATRRQGSCPSLDDLVEIGRLSAPRPYRSTIATINP